MSSRLWAVRHHLSVHRLSLSFFRLLSSGGKMCCSSSTHAIQTPCTERKQRNVIEDFDVARHFILMEWKIHHLPEPIWIVHLAKVALIDVLFGGMQNGPGLDPDSWMEAGHHRPLLIIGRDLQIERWSCYCYPFLLLWISFRMRWKLRHSDVLNNASLAAMHIWSERGFFEQAASYISTGWNCLR